VKPPPDPFSGDTPLALSEGTLALGPSRSVSQPPPDDAVDPWIGRILAGRYAIVSVLGRGGMGVVYEARHVSLQRKVAVKVLRPDLSRDAEALRRFEREALAAAAIGNAHIVDVIDFGYGAEGEAYLVMECLEGVALSTLVRLEAPLPEARAVEIARQVAEALSAAHGKGIVHRDLKSDNVFLVQRGGQDFVKVVDFGISKVHEDADGRAPITRDGVILGTPRYMAPEQGTDGAEADHRVDLYALGCILFEMLTGSVPFTGRTAVEVLYKQVHAAPPRLASVRPEVSADLDVLVARLLAKSPDDRFADAAALLAALPAPLRAPSVPTPERVDSLPPPGPSTTPEVARWRARVIAAGFVAAGALVTEAVWRSTLPTRVPRPVSATTLTARPSPPRPLAPPASVDAGPPPTVDRALVPPPDAVPAVATPTCGLTLRVWPAVARVTADEAPCGRAGCTVTRPCGASVTFVAQAPGYVAQRESLTLTAPQNTTTWRLVRSGPVRGSGPRPGAQTPTVVPPEAPRPPPVVGPSMPGGAGPDGLRSSPYRVP